MAFDNLVGHTFSVTGDAETFEHWTGELLEITENFVVIWYMKEDSTFPVPLHMDYSFRYGT